MVCENPKKAIKRHPNVSWVFFLKLVVFFISFWGKKGKKNNVS
jgi:hypothetical protein